MRKIVTAGVVTAVLLLAAPASDALDSFKFMVDRSTLWCPDGLVAIEDPENIVLEKCGEPTEVIQHPNIGPVWAYSFRDDRFMYYLVVFNGRLQRIASTPCNQNRYDCFDLR